MSYITKIFKNASLLMISQIITAICGFVWTIIIIRYLGVSENGIFGFATSFSGIVAVTMDLGVGTHIVRHIATNYDSAPKYLGNTLPLKAIFSICTFGISLVILIFLNSNPITIIITLLFIIQMIFKSFTAFLNGCFQAFEEGKFQAISNIMLNIILLIFIFLTVYSNMGLFGIAYSYIISNIIAFIYAYYILNKYFAKPKFEFDKKFCKEVTKSSIPFAATGLLYTIYYSIDILMLTNIMGNYETGLYNATYKLISVPTLIYTVYSAILFPMMSKFYKKNEKLLLISYEKSIKYLLLFMVPLATYTTFFSLEIIELFYEPIYDLASPTLSILIWTVCFLFISGAGNTLLNASHKEVTVTKIYIIAALFNITLNLFMIPHLSYNGAAITTVLSDILIVIIQSYVIYKLGHRPDKKLYYDILKIIAGSAILGIALYFLNLNMWVALPVGIIIYFAVVYLLRVFDDDDKYVVKEILGRN